MRRFTIAIAGALLVAPAIAQTQTFTPRDESPEEFAALIRADYEKWGPVIKAAGIEAE